HMVTPRVAAIASTECAVKFFEPAGKRQQRVAGRVEAVDFVVRLDECFRRAGLYREAVLNRYDGSNIPRIVGVKQNSNTNQDVPRFVLITRQRMFTGLVQDAGYE